MLHLKPQDYRSFQCVASKSKNFNLFRKVPVANAVSLSIISQLIARKLLKIERLFLFIGQKKKKTLKDRILGANVKKSSVWEVLQATQVWRQFEDKVIANKYENDYFKSPCNNLLILKRTGTLLQCCKCHSELFSHWHM